MPNAMYRAWGKFKKEPDLFLYIHYRDKYLHREPTGKWFAKLFKPPEFTILGEELPLTLFYTVESNLSSVFEYHAFRA